MSILTHDGKILVKNGTAYNMDSLIEQANEATGKDDKTLSDAVQSLVDGMTGQTPYEERSLTITSAMSAKEISEAFNYTVKYKESLVIVQAFGAYNVTTTYCLACFMARQKNGSSGGKGVDYYGRGSNPNRVMNTLGEIEDGSYIRIENGKYVVTSNNQMGGIGCTVKLYEIPIGVSIMPYNLEEMDDVV